MPVMRKKVERGLSRQGDLAAYEGISLVTQLYKVRPLINPLHR